MYLGIDTSNYTTSLALFDGENVFQQKKLLTVKSGERGLRQSDAVFQHTLNMYELSERLMLGNQKIDAVGVSTRPRNVDGSYMPCFLVGKSHAKCISVFADAKLYNTSHQIGHILAALYSANKLQLVGQQFIAFHVSGGTTEALLVTPHKDELIRASVISESLDLKAGQAIDRAGVMMGLEFPCGKELDALSQQSDREFKVNPSIIGSNCSLSGIENKAKAMFDRGESKEDISKFVLCSVLSAVDKMTQMIINSYGELPIVYAGGVMSNTLIKSNIMKQYSNAYFAAPEFSCDNACGTAIYAYLKDQYE